MADEVDGPIGYVLDPVGGDRIPGLVPDPSRLTEMLLRAVREDVSPSGQSGVDTP